MKQNGTGLAGKLLLGTATVAVAAVLLASQGISLASAASTDSGWDKNGVPSFLKTPTTGTRLDAPAKNATFGCIKVAIPGTPLKIKIGPHLGRSMTQAQTPWVQNNKVIISKIEIVPGSVKMKSELKITEENNIRHFKSNGIPNHPIGTFPIPKDSLAYKYYSVLPADGYANAAEIPVAPYDLDVTLPLNPTIAKKPKCIPDLMTGFALTGAAWHVEMAADMKIHTFDPNAALPTDNCFGHPYATQYHYHGYSWKCMEQGKSGKQSPLLGWALDGFGIYGPLDSKGKVITNAQLDVCHGMVSEVNFNGKMQKIYHYVLNNEYPYSIGCFRGTPLKQMGSMKH